MSEQNPSHAVEGIVCSAPRQDYVEGTDPGYGYQNIYQNNSEVLKVPKNTVGSIILKWKKFGTRDRAITGHPAKLSNWGRRAFGQGGDQEPNGHSDRAPEFLCGDGRTFQKDNHLCSTPPIKSLWSNDQTEATPALSWICA